MIRRFAGPSGLAPSMADPVEEFRLALVVAQRPCDPPVAEGRARRKRRLDLPPNSSGILHRPGRYRAVADDRLALQASRMVLTAWSSTRPRRSKSTPAAV